MSSEKKKWIVPLAVLATAIVVTLVLLRVRPEVRAVTPERSVPVVRVVEVSPTDVRLDVRSQGTVASSRQSEITAQVSGKIVSVAPEFAEGSFVREGALLVRLDARDFEVGVAQAEANLAQARTRLAREEAEAAVAREDWEELGSGPPTPLVLRQPQLAEARAAVDAAEAAVMQARLNLARTSIRAPFDGRVLVRKANLGQFVTPGTPVATIFATDYAEIALPVTSAELSFVDLSRIGSANSPRVVLTNEVAGMVQRWEGQLIRTGGAIDPSSRMLELIARVDQPFRTGAARVPLELGMFVQAEIEGTLARDVFVLPRSAVRSDSHVLIVDQDLRIRMRRVGVIRTSESRAIVSSGLEEGDRVVVTTLATPVEGMVVEVVEGGEPEVSSRDGAEVQ